MKNVFLLSTRLSMFLTEIPLIALVTVAIHFNESAEGWAKLYPLITVTAAAVVFIMVYLFRGVLINCEEIRSVGLFSSKDHASISKNKSLVITLMKKNKLKLELFGEDDAPGLDWLRDVGRRDYVNLYRDVAYGGIKGVRRLLSAFDFDKHQINSLLYNDCASISVFGIDCKREKTDIGDTYTLHFTETL